MAPRVGYMNLQPCTGCRSTVARTFRRGRRIRPAHRCGGAITLAYADAEPE